jgi:hypothetical protein
MSRKSALHLRKHALHLRKRARLPRKFSSAQLHGEPHTYFLSHRTFVPSLQDLPLCIHQLTPCDDSILPQVVNIINGNAADSLAIHA